MLGTLLKKFDKYDKTCSVTHLEDKAVTFLRDEKYIQYLKDVKEDIWLIAPNKLEGIIRKYQEAYCPTVNVHYTDWPEFEFTLYHNQINKGKRQSSPCIGDNCNIHETAVIGIDGLKLVHCPNGEKIQFTHTGHVLIGRNVDIGPFTVVHRGTMGVTSIGEGCKIGAHNNIGHNCKIGASNVMAVGVIFNGGVFTGHNCWFGSGAKIKHYTNIHDNVVVGMGAVVVKNIEKSGIYVGNPARFLKECKEGWNF